eukprot:TRINITY_DN16361_c0_g1_i6.p6 TRINITY_DN16361_c0_g1~~TRINITY_DN16361_c0_g1_i6.p6  ORF type:complete len:159 (+),score=8.40 TRINITY_DN16361_c0_g1_i6:906-1382(+)
MDFYLSSAGGKVNTIPPEISMLRSLEKIELLFQEFVGTIPPEMSVLTSLTQINLFDNFLTGSLPKELSTLSNLSYFSVYDNDLTSILPVEYSKWGQKVTNLQFQKNKFSGTIPDQYSVFTKASEFDAFPQVGGSLCLSLSSPSQLASSFSDEFSKEIC